MVTLQMSSDCVVKNKVSEVKKALLAGEYIMMIDTFPVLVENVIHYNKNTEFIEVFKVSENKLNHKLDLYIDLMVNAKGFNTDSLLDYLTFVIENYDWLRIDKHDNINKIIISEETNL